MASLRFGIAAVLAAAASASCASIREDHGYVADQLSVDQPVQAGVDTKSTVLARMGSPSTRGAFDDQNWYYVSTSTKAYAFFKPDITRRDIVAVHFGPDDVVEAVDVYGLERGRVIAYNGKSTPTRGRELGFFEQLFGSIGNAPIALPNSEENVPGGRP